MNSRFLYSFGKRSICAVELGRKTQDWNQAREKLAAIANLSTHDFRLFLGNFFLHQGNFGIIGLWWPKRRDQLNLTF